MLITFGSEKFFKWKSPVCETAIHRADIRSAPTRTPPTYDKIAAACAEANKNRALSKPSQKEDYVGAFSSSLFGG